MKRSQKWSPTIIVVIVAIIVVVTTLQSHSNSQYLLQKNTTISSPSTQPITQSNTPSAQPPIKPSSSAITTGILLTEASNGWKIFRSSNNYEFNFPSEWQEDPDNKSYAGNTKLIYYADGEKFSFSVADSGGGGPRADEIKNSMIYLDGNKFTKRLWIKDGYVFFVAVIPESNSYRDPTSTVSNNVENINFTLPRDKNTQYQQLMDQVLATFKFFDKK